METKRVLPVTRPKAAAPFRLARYSRTKAEYLEANSGLSFLTVLIAVNVSHLHIFAAWACDNVLTLKTALSLIQVVKYQYIAIALITLDG